MRRKNPDPWPPRAKAILEAVGEDYAEAVRKGWADEDVLLDEAISSFMDQVAPLASSASDEWRDRYDDGRLEKDIRKALRDYARTSRMHVNPKARTRESAPVVGRTYKIGGERVRVTDIVDGSVEVESLDTVNAGFIRLADWKKHAKPGGRR